MSECGLENFVDVWLVAPLHCRYASLTLPTHKRESAMTRRILALLLVISMPAVPLRAQRAAAARTPDARVAAAIREDALWAPLRFLSSDLLEGRGTGARGGEVAAQYLASQFMLMGLTPAGDSGTW